MAELLCEGARVLPPR